MSTILLRFDPDRINDQTRRDLEAASAGYDLWFSKVPGEENPDRLSEVEITTGWRIPEALLHQSQLTWHHQLSAGMDWLLAIPERESFPFTITNVSGMHGTQMAAHAFAMIFSLSRGLVQPIRNQASRHWEHPDPSQLLDLSGKTILVVGAGAIGSCIARIARGHGMRTVGIRRDPTKPNPDFDSLHNLNELDDLLPGSHVVVLSLPSTPGTENLFSRKQFDRMPERGIFINVGRGSHVNEDALAEVLASGKLQGAGCDAFKVEPLPEDSPLWNSGNMIVSPHCAGSIGDYLDRAMAVFIENLKRRATGQPMINIVDKKLGY